MVSFITSTVCTAAMAAVSVRKRLSPKLTGIQPFCLADSMTGGMKKLPNCRNAFFNFFIFAQNLLRWKRMFRFWS